MSTTRYTLAQAQADINALAAGQAAILETLQALTVSLSPASPAKVTQPKAAPKPKADAAYRSAATKAKVREQVDALYAADRAKYGVKRWSDIPAKAQATTKAQIKALWAAAPKTRKTPAK